MQLEENLYDQVVAFSTEGDALMESSKYEEAIDSYHRALELLPEPKSSWEAFTWLSVAIGDVYFETDDYESALIRFKTAQKGAEALDNPFIYLRIGQCAYELANKQQAIDNLLRAYMLDGIDIFEDEDVKYINYLKSSISLTIE
ncbi:tetratricopeptide repeat protein [Marivirga tractuosa]|uniref:tetratricopeptide repeat protein n=1 Tax=Marivirga tractuosa TaxID=1006 RepID=UPI0035CF18DC